MHHRHLHRLPLQMHAQLQPCVADKSSRLPQRMLAAPSATNLFGGGAGDSALSSSLHVWAWGSARRLHCWAARTLDVNYYLVAARRMYTPLGGAPQGALRSAQSRASQMRRRWRCSPARLAGNGG